ncbi:YqjF family protein [Aureispira anguillae]|uniref:DUF2071 domain-containing protein n=1 Tax=Aureispira anguillae TaxID=2864201 RepID=A0A915YJ99_9BACT|nr:DUF2071 domain-containing protein [Aureispira anguillae]BDS14233.1 DUF2071 domain-containing protein [Aureispira anguillae]
MKFLTAEWRKLILANYLVEPELLKPYLPMGTELDDWNGKLHLSLVGFLFLNTKVLGVPIPFYRNFEEINLRFYVRYQHGSEWRRGVVFIKEIVPKRMISWVANTIYGEHYETLPMRHVITSNAQKMELSYEAKKNQQWHKMKVEAIPQPLKIKEGSEAEFITEHFWGYTRLNDQKTAQYEVGHPTWDMYQVCNFETEGDFSQIYGEQFAFINQQPDSVFLAEGSEIFVMKGANVKA